MSKWVWAKDSIVKIDLDKIIAFSVTPSARAEEGKGFEVHAWDGAGDDDYWTMARFNRSEEAYRYIDELTK